jgi:hypothetical protein
MVQSPLRQNGPALGDPSAHHFDDDQKFSANIARSRSARNLFGLAHDAASAKVCSRHMMTVGLDDSLPNEQETTQYV